jgi:hypothetical protein
MIRDIDTMSTSLQHTKRHIQIIMEASRESDGYGSEICVIYLLSGENFDLVFAQKNHGTRCLCIEYLHFLCAHFMGEGKLISVGVSKHYNINVTLRDCKLFYDRLNQLFLFAWDA